MLVAQNADVRLATDEDRLEELRRQGFKRCDGRVWGRNDCMADSMTFVLLHVFVPSLSNRLKYKEFITKIIYLDIIIHLNF